MQDFWDTRYRENAYAYGTEANVWLRDKLVDLTPGHIYLPGEGEGRNAVYAAGLGWDVTAVDYSSAGREKALALAASAGVPIDYRIADLTSYVPPVAAYDAAALIYIHLPDPMRSIVHQRTVDALKPGGTLIVEAFAKEQLEYGTGGPKTADLLYDVAMLRADFCDMETVEEHRIDIEVREGAYHDGMSAVIRLLLRKS